MPGRADQPRMVSGETGRFGVQRVRRNSQVMVNFKAFLSHKGLKCSYSVEQILLNVQASAPRMAEVVQSLFSNTFSDRRSLLRHLRTQDKLLACCKPGSPALSTPCTHASCHSTRLKTSEYSSQVLRCGTHQACVTCPKLPHVCVLDVSAPDHSTAAFDASDPSSAGRGTRWRRWKASAAGA